MGRAPKRSLPAAEESKSKEPRLNEPEPEIIVVKDEKKKGCQKCGEGGGTLAICDGCEAEYHLHCVGLTEEDCEQMDTWFCGECARPPPVQHKQPEQSKAEFKAAIKAEKAAAKALAAEEKQRKKEQEAEKKQQEKLAKALNKRPGRFESHASQATRDRIARAIQHRLFLIERRPVSADGLSGGFVVLGNTGNVYDVNIGQRSYCSCPDNSRNPGNCKHIIFVMLRVLKVSRDNPVVWNKSLTQSEVREIFENAPANPAEVVADASVITAYHGGGAPPAAPEVKQRPVEGDCPVCYEEFAGGEAVVFCQGKKGNGCGNNIHKACFDKWAAQQRGGAVTCVLCRAEWQASAGKGKAPLAVSPNGYANLAAQSHVHMSTSDPARYTSGAYLHGGNTYKNRWFRRY